MDGYRSELVMKFADFINFSFPTDELIRGGSRANGKDWWVPFPIGIEPKISYETLEAIPKATNKLLCYCNVREECFRGTEKRKKALQNVYKKSFITFEGKSDPKTRHQENPPPLTNRAYFANMSKHKFAISPEGNGLDTHRTYEALICKTIPIVQYNKEIMEKYKRLPVLATEQDYKELTVKYLNKKYEEILETEFDFNRLLKSYWVKKNPGLEPTSKYWLNKFKEFNTKKEKETEDFTNPLV